MVRCTSSLPESTYFSAAILLLVVWICSVMWKEGRGDRTRTCSVAKCLWTDSSAYVRFEVFYHSWSPWGCLVFLLIWRSCPLKFKTFSIFLHDCSFYLFELKKITMLCYCSFVFKVKLRFKVKSKSKTCQLKYCFLGFVFVFLLLACKSRAVSFTNSQALCFCSWNCGKNCAWSSTSCLFNCKSEILVR